MSAKKVTQPRGPDGKFLSKKASGKAAGAPSADRVATALGVPPEAYKKMVTTVEAEVGTDGWTVVGPFVEWFCYMMNSDGLDQPQVDWAAYSATMASALEAKAAAGGDTKRAAAQALFGTQKKTAPSPSNGGGQNGGGQDEDPAAAWARLGQEMGQLMGKTLGQSPNGK